MLENVLDVGRYGATGRTFGQEGFRKWPQASVGTWRVVRATGSRGNADSLQCDHPITVNVPCHSTGDFHSPHHQPRLKHHKQTGETDSISDFVF